jgi:hypothetical protein
MDELEQNKKSSKTVSDASMSDDNSSHDSNGIKLDQTERSKRREELDKEKTDRTKYKIVERNKQDA